jgi:hypothetical protein
MPEPSSPLTHHSFSHLASREGTITLIGFGSLVCRGSAAVSFPFTNFRSGVVRGYRRIFNRASWIHTQEPGAAVTGEVSGLAFFQQEGALSRVCLLDVEASAGVAAFLAREHFYVIQALPYEDEHGRAGCALACLEAPSDAAALALWGSSSHPHSGGVQGTVWRFPPSAAAAMPLTPEVIAQGSVQGQATGEPAAAAPAAAIALPERQWIYPARRYTRLCYLAHCMAGMEEELLDNAVLMDRQTTLRAYLEANPEAKAWITDKQLHEDRRGDSFFR